MLIVKPKTILKYLDQVGHGLRTRGVPTAAHVKHTNNNVPYVETCFGHRVVFFSKTKTYRLFRNFEKLADFQGYSYNVAGEIVEFIRSNANGLGRSVIVKQLDIGPGPRGKGNFGNTETVTKCIVTDNGYVAAWMTHDPEHPALVI